MLDLTPVGPGMTVDDYINGGGGMSEPSVTPDLWVYEWDTFDDAVHRGFHPGYYNGRKCDRAVAYFKVPADAIREAVLAERDHWKAEAESWEKQASDRVDDALKFAAERDALKAENAFIRTLMNCYNLGGWTDSLRLMQERNALARDAAYWKEEARRYCENADFWREKATNFAEKGASDE